MGRKIPFNVNAYTARLIGRENVSTLEGAILELVKNTYDADATKCVLYYENFTQTLYLMDNGTGMTEEIIEKHWMTIGNSSKYKQFVTSRGRIQTGAKGIGRFALDRIGDICVMHTKNDKVKNVIEWNVDWRNFNREEIITDITAEIDYTSEESLIKFLINIKNKEILELLESDFTNTGTVFKIQNLRDDWNSDLVDKIKQSLASLLPPDIDNEFAIYLFNENAGLKDSLINSKGIDSYDYKIQFSSKENNIEIKIDRNEFEFNDDELDEIIDKTEFSEDDKRYFSGECICINKTLSEIFGNDMVENIGDFNGRFYFNKIKVQKNEKEKYYYKDITGRKNYADIFGGIKLYRDNFRVRPYGEAKSSSYDWLLLGSRRAKSPAAISHETGRWRVTPEQICGIVNISRMNVNLPDQSNRGGIVETKEFNALKEILLAIINEFEKDRQYVGRILDKYYEIKHPKKVFEKEIEEKAKREADAISKNQELDSSTMISASKAKIVIESERKKVETLEVENSMLRNLATAGIVTNQYIHETKGNVNSIGLNVSTAKDALVFKKDIDRAIKNLIKTQEYLESLNSWFDVTIDSIKRDKRNMKYTDINVLINKQVEKWKNALENQNINITYNAEEIGMFECFPYEIESIISNLIANSVSAFRGIKEREIDILITKLNNGFKLVYKDTGKGLSDKYKKEPRKILEAFETDKMNGLNEIIGTGMGMWIVDNIVKRYNGKIDLEKNIHLEKGFYIEIILEGIIKE